jgi:hypothetical protein
VKVVSLEVNLRHLRVGHFDLGRVCIRVEFTFDSQAGLRGRRGDPIDDDFVTL